MAQLFSGYAQQRGFRASSRRGRNTSIDQQYVRSVDQARQLDNQNAVDIHNSLQEQFNIDQQARQTFLDLESRAAGLERQAKMDQFNAEIKNAQARDKDRIEMYEALATVSKTAADTLVKERSKQKQAQLKLSQNLTLQYGLTPDEVLQLQSLEGGLLDYEAQQAPVLHKLRSAGASESDINVLMKNSGWNAYGAALGAVQNAGENYDLYLTSKQAEDVTINGVSMSLASAEARGDVRAIAGIFDRHRSNFLQEYLSGYDPAFVAKHIREPIQQAESRRKRNLSTRMEKMAREGNEAKDTANLITHLKSDPTNPQTFIDYVEMQAGGRESNQIGTVHNYYHKPLVEGLKNNALPRTVGEGILNSTVFAKHLGREATYREAFPMKSAQIVEAMDEADSERLRIKNNAIKATKVRGAQMAQDFINYFGSNPEALTTQSIQDAQREVLATGNLEAANKLAKLLPYSTEKTNDKEFDAYWTKQKALGNYPTNEQILFGGLSDGKLTTELQQRRDFEDTGLTKDVLKNIDDRVESLLRTQLGEAYGNTTKTLPESYTAAFNAAKSQVMMDFRVAYKGPQSSFEAEQYAIGELKKELAKENGRYKVNVIGEETTNRRGQTRYKFDPGFSNFMGVSPVKKESSLPAIVDAHANGTEAFRSQLFVDSGRVKNIVSNLNKGIVKPYPSEFFAINKSLKGKVPMSEIIMSQIEQARKEDPSIPELKPEIKSIFQKAERAMDPNILGIIQRYNTPATVDRGLVQSNIPAIYDRDQPYVSFGRMIEATGRMRPDLIPMFLAIGNEESRFDLTADTSKSGTDPNKVFEWSRGPWQVNWLAHSDKLTRVGMTPDDLLNPVKNLEAALMVYEERVQLLVNKGVPLEEAQLRGFEPWSVYTSGKYKYSLPEAQRRWNQYKSQANLPTWQQSSYMNPEAQRWLEKNRGGVWIG